MLFLGVLGLLACGSDPTFGSKAEAEAACQKWRMETIEDAPPCAAGDPPVGCTDLQKRQHELRFASRGLTRFRCEPEDETRQVVAKDCGDHMAGEPLEVVEACLIPKFPGVRFRY